MPRCAGNDLNESITPVEAGLTWTIGKKRREACDFLGGEVDSPRSALVLQKCYYPLACLRSPQHGNKQHAQGTLRETGEHCSALSSLSAALSCAVQESEHASSG